MIFEKYTLRIYALALKAGALLFVPSASLHTPQAFLTSAGTGGHTP
jgi:hypothetical protein